MKRISHIIVLFAFFGIFLSSFPSCEEVPPIVPMGQLPDTTVDVSQQKRQVLIEEFTGVRCVNCPAGSAEIQDLLLVYGEQLVAISIHAGEYSPPLPESMYDFRTEDGDQLINFIGAPFGYPSASVDRKLFDGEFSLQLSKSKWAGYIAQEAAEEPRVKIAIEPAYSGADRSLEVKVTLYPQEDLSAEDLKLSVAITEDGIIDYQITPDGEVPDYEHRHVLRDMLTAYDGDAITEALLPGSSPEFTYDFTVPAAWNEEHCHVVAFVSQTGAGKDVLQVHQVPMKK